MTLGEKIRVSRFAQDMKVSELAKKMGVSERTIYSYEQKGARPRKSTLEKLAKALGVTVEYLTNEEETVDTDVLNQEFFFGEVKARYGSTGVREAKDVLSRASALFAGGELSDGAMDLFNQSIMKVFLLSKAEASKKFGKKKQI